MDFAALTTMSSEDRATALALDFSALDNDALTAALTERRNEATRLFALESPSIAEVDVAEALVASITSIEGEQAARTAAVEDAANRFAAARATFAGEAEGDEGDEADESDEDEEDEEDEESDDADESEDSEDGEGEGDGEGDGEGVTTASARNARASQRVTTRKRSAASKVAARTKRPARKAANPVTITASADVPGFAASQTLDGLTEVAKAVQARVRGFSGWNARAAQQAHERSGGKEVLNKFGVASFHVANTHGADLNDKSGTAAEYDAVGEAVKAHVERVNASLGYEGESAMAAAMAWCSPSEVVYNWVADFVVDGLFDLPEVNAPRGGLMLTEGPQLLQTTYGDGAAIDGFGFGGTEAQMEAGYVKTCETIECPEFVDHRLDFDGYCWKIPILTQKTFPELIADALRVSDVAYAHKMNRRFIKNVIDESTAIDATGGALGGSVMDTIEALVQIATKERRWWNIGENAVLEVKLPQEARDIFKIDMQRRAGLALSDIATDQRINALFANYRLSVKYLSDFDQRYGAATPTADWPGAIRAIIYPAGTFVKAQDDVITLQAVYDAASLSQNEYTGVFYEQGVKVIKRGYRSHVVTIPVCTAGATGGSLPTCDPFVGSL